MKQLTASEVCEQGLVSVVMPTYKGAHSLGRAIESVLAQDYAQFELIVVDDNPADSSARAETQDVMSRYASEQRIKYIRHSENMNGAAARNTGISASRGEFLAFLDDDDVMMPQRLSASVSALSAAPEASMLFADVLHVYDVDGHMNLYVMNPCDLTPTGILLNEAAVGTGSNLFCRRSVVLEIDGFDTRFVRHQDLEFSIRMLEARQDVVVLHDCLVVKGYNGVSNVPDYAKLRDIKDLYNDVFAPVIETLEPRDAEAYWCNVHMSLYRSALRANNYSAARSHLRSAVEHGWSRGVKETVQLLLARLGIFTVFVKDDKRAATVSNGTHAEATHPDAYEYYLHMGELAAQKG